MLNTLAANLAADLACLTSLHSAVVPELPSCLPQPAQLLGAHAPKHPAPRNGRRASSFHAAAPPTSSTLGPSPNSLVACDDVSPAGQRPAEWHAQLPLISGSKGPAADKAGARSNSPYRPTVQQMVAQIMTPSRAEGRRRLRASSGENQAAPCGGAVDRSQAASPKVTSKRQADLMLQCSGFALIPPVKAHAATLSAKFEMACGHGMDQTFRSSVPSSAALQKNRGSNAIDSFAASKPFEDALFNEQWATPNPASTDVQARVPDVHLRSSSLDSYLSRGSNAGGHSKPTPELLSRTALDDDRHQQALLATLRAEPHTPPRLHVPHTPPRCGRGRRPPLIWGSN